MAWPTGKSRKEYNNQHKAVKHTFNIPHIIGHYQTPQVGNPPPHSTDGNNDSSPIPPAENKRAVVSECCECAEGVECDSVSNNLESASKGGENQVFRNLLKLVDYKGKYEECVCQHCRGFEERVREVVGKILKGV
jgi:hypothetical protein